MHLVYEDLYLSCSEQEWPDEVYPTYANGLGYIISTNIAQFIVTQSRRKALEVLDPYLCTKLYTPTLFVIYQNAAQF